MTSYADLQAQIKKLQDQAEKQKAKELESVITGIKQQIAEYGLTAEQLGLAPARKKTVKKAAVKTAVVMYRNGDLTWSGAARGRKPSWVKEIMDAGGDIEKYRVKGKSHR
ncbi:H-NS histone family protein [Herbaspirillum huttiense]|uniref:H-NS histone family protein n=1 Tax=Herbaspirillum huttiense TaxID=863372 RepID=UPI001066F80C|nr:H-NS histone family protein [Herbaspirillum huttiense]QBP75279.1 H-NS histone family protein [Herbaspirillum huttiense]